MESGSLTLFRLDKLERSVHELRSETASIPLIAQRVDILTEKVDTLTKALMAASGSVVAGSIIFAFSVFELVG